MASMAMIMRVPVSRMLNRLIVFLLLTSSFCGWSQTCANPELLCAEEAAGLEVLTNNPLSFGCFDVQQSYFYNFETNNNANADNAVQISVQEINCPGSAGLDSVFAIVVQYVPGSDPCDPASYIVVSNCEMDSVDFSFEVPNIVSNSQYFVIVGSNQDPSNGPCGFDVDIEGEPVDIQSSVFPIEIALGETAQLSVIGGDATVGYTWSPFDYLNDPFIPDPVSLPDETITYMVEGQVGDCTVTDFVTVTVGPPVVVLNAFTPNHDGYNDVWTIQGIERFENCLVTVYDRWGQQVFKSLGYNKPWNGTADGRFLPTASYYYVIELNSLDVRTKPLTGAIAIIH